MYSLSFKGGVPALRSLAASGLPLPVPGGGHHLIHSTCSPLIHLRSGTQSLVWLSCACHTLHIQPFPPPLVWKRVLNARWTLLILYFARLLLKYASTAADIPWAVWYPPSDTWHGGQSDISSDIFLAVVVNLNSTPSASPPERGGRINIYHSTSNCFVSLSMACPPLTVDICYFHLFSLKQNKISVLLRKEWFLVRLVWTVTFAVSLLPSSFLGNLDL